MHYFLSLFFRFLFLTRFLASRLMQSIPFNFQTIQVITLSSGIHTRKLEIGLKVRVTPLPLRLFGLNQSKFEDLTNF